MSRVITIINSGAARSVAREHHLKNRGKLRFLCHFLLAHWKALTELFHSSP